MTHKFGVASLAAILLISVPSITTAAPQSDAPQAPSQAQAQAPAPAPLRHERTWHGSLNFGLAVASGAQAQRGYQVAAGLKHAFTDGGTLVAQASKQYQRVTFPDEAVLSDRSAASLGIDLNPTKHTVVMVRSMYLRDKQMYVNSRFEQLAGVGVHLYDEKKRFEFQFIPGFSLFKQDLGYSDIHDWETGWGFFEKFTAHINESWSFDNSFRFRSNFKDDDKSIESVTSLNGRITKAMGMQLEYQYNHESIVPPGYPAYFQVLSAGLKFQF